jgi:hypothetical protein
MHPGTRLSLSAKGTISVHPGMRFFPNKKAAPFWKRLLSG